MQRQGSNIPPFMAKNKKDEKRAAIRDAAKRRLQKMKGGKDQKQVAGKGGY